MRISHFNCFNGAFAAGNLASFMLSTLLATSIIGLAAAQGEKDTYVIYPIDGEEDYYTIPIENRLKELTKGDYYASGARGSINFYRADLTSQQAQEMRDLPEGSETNRFV